MKAIDTVQPIQGQMPIALLSAINNTVLLTVIYQPVINTIVSDPPCPDLRSNDLFGNYLNGAGLIVIKHSRLLWGEIPG
jgi:hypothetical protein